MPDYHPEFGPAATVVTCALMALVIGLATRSGGRRIRDLLTRRAGNPRALRRAYWRSFLLWWPATAIALAVAALDPGLGLAAIGVTTVAGEAVPIWPVAAGFLVLAGFGLMRRRRVFARMPALPPALTRLAAILPATPAERRLAGWVAVTAGVCEEVIFRGLLIAAGVGILGLSLWWSLGLATVLFGLCHLYQGWLRALVPTAVGLALGLVYLGSGNLILPILFHTVIDLLAFLTVPYRLVTQALGIGAARPQVEPEPDPV